MKNTRTYFLTPEIFREITSISAEDLATCLCERQEGYAGELAGTKDIRVCPSDLKRANALLTRLFRDLEKGNPLEFGMTLSLLKTSVPHRDEFTVPLTFEMMNEEAERERDYIDALTQLIERKTAGDETAYNKALRMLRKSGVTISVPTESEIRAVLRMMGNDAHKIRHVWKVSNSITEKRFRDNLNGKNTTLLWHGSKTNCFWSILRNGLLLDKASFGMFGKGIYFAPKFDKSRGYTSVSGSRWANGNDGTAFLGIFEVRTGNPMVTESEYSHSYRTSLPGYDCIWAKAGPSLHNDEVIVYDETASTIRYVVETE